MRVVVDFAVGASDDRGRASLAEGSQNARVNLLRNQATNHPTRAAAGLPGGPGGGVGGGSRKPSTQARGACAIATVVTYAVM